jgi:hypothetical protein
MTDADAPFTNNQGENDIREDPSPAKNRRLLSLPGRRRHLLPGAQLFVDLPQKSGLCYASTAPAVRRHFPGFHFVRKDGFAGLVIYFAE